LVAGSYFLLARIGLLTISNPSKIPVIWLAGGLLLALLLLNDWRRWWWLVGAALAADVIAQLAAGRTVPVAIGFAAAGCAETVLAAIVVKRLLDPPYTLDRLRSALVLTVAAAAASAVGALLGAAVAAAGLGTGYGAAWVLSWLVSFVGLLAATPVVLALADAYGGIKGRVKPPSVAQIVEVVVVLGGLTAVSLVIFTRPVHGSRLFFDFGYPTLPFLVWAALRFGSRGGPFAMLLLWAIATAGTVSGRGPFTSAAYGTHGHLLQLEAFLAISCLITVLGGALADEFRRRERRLTATNFRLEQEGEALRAAQQRFHSVLESTPDGMLVVDEAGKILLVNAEAERLFGYSREELVGAQLEMLVPERYREAHIAIRRRYVENPTTRRIGPGLDLRLLRKDGRELEVEIRLSALPSNGHIQISAAVRDVSDRRQLIERLEQRGRLMDLVHDAIIVRDPADSSIGYWNRAASEIYGYSAEQALGRTVHELLQTEPPEPLEAIDAQLAERGRWEGEVHQVRADGRRILVSSRLGLQRDERGEPVAVIEHNSDITEQRRVEEAKYRLAAMVEHTDDAVVGGTIDGKITEWNRGAQRLYGYTAEEAIGQPADMLMPPERRAQELKTLARVYDGEAFRQYETVRIRKDGTPVHVSLTVSPIKDGRGRVVAASAIGRDITERKRFEDQLRHLADHDYLTGLFNRRRFDEELQREIARAQRYGTGGTVLAIDIDHFKYVNDSLGHSAGDALIGIVAELFRKRLRETDMIARLGGDEFGVILPGVERDEAEVVAKGLLEAIRAEKSFQLPRTLRQLTASIGIAPFADVAELTSEDLLVEADIAMYDAKEAGRDRMAVYGSTDGRQGRLKARMTWGDRIHRALEEDRFVLHAQPILSLDGDRAPRHELLVRMVGDNGDVIPPNSFLFIAERMDLIQEIDRWVLREACGLLADQQRSGAEVKLAVNLSAKSIADPSLPEAMAEILAAAGADGSGLCIEVTETAAIVNVDRARRFATQISELGCEFALDDFGAGFATFYYLKHLPFDYLKIDGEFVQGIVGSLTDQLVVKSLAEIAHGLGKRTIAEFVSSRGALDLLREYGIDYAQGFFISESKPLDEIDLTQPAGVAPPAA
jgi:diguanylate cyclase (GGDEF)-like protein/PAS domain S-box-containing protein